MSIQTLSKKERKDIAKLKTLAFRLYKNKQITYKLYVLILGVDNKDVTYVTELKALTEDLVRIKGYYHSPQRVLYADTIIEEWLKQIQS